LKRDAFTASIALLNGTKKVRAVMLDGKKMAIAFPINPSKTLKKRVLRMV
jgi:hypothetical protein